MCSKAIFLIIPVFFSVVLNQTVNADEPENNTSCFVCHSNENLSMEFPSGEEISL